ncbi:MAG: DUF1330 domain-containing protein [Actinomycetota bacterium]|nr:DUF1330 domain-containing protein [Actinomycetota bacterium]
MAAYVVCDIEVTDPEGYEGYKALSGPSVEKYGGRYLARGAEVAVLEGEWRPSRFVIIEFDDVATARRWYDGPEYTEAREIRQASSKASFILAPGV